MKRMTIQGFDFDSNFEASNLQCWPIAQALKKLQAYEDTGLEPKEVPTGLELANVYAALEQLKQYEAIGSIDHLRELATNEQKGRMVVLPGEPIAARYDVADMLDDFKKEAEFYDHSVGINGITWAESGLLAAVIDGLNIGRKASVKASEENNDV